MGKNIIFILIFILFSAAVIADVARPSMRKCMLLPVTDHVGGAIAFKVFQEVEYYLKEATWCKYRSNSEVINILGNYKNNLNAYLENKQVLQTIAEKVDAGTLIKINVSGPVGKTEIETIVYGDAGDEVYLREKIVLDTDEIVVVVQTVKNWLEVYERTIPYDARITGVLQDQFTCDVDKEATKGLINSPVIVVRADKRKKHPLLKEVVDWEVKKIGDGKIFHVSSAMVQGKIIGYEDPKNKMKIGDWIRVIKSKEPEQDIKMQYPELQEQDFGKLGNVGIFFNFGKGSASSNPEGREIKKISGKTIGIDLSTELWATRNYWMGFDYTRKVAYYKSDTGTIENKDNVTTVNNYKLKFAYKFLPLGFFFGPQIDTYLGYAKFSHGLETSVSDGFTDFSFAGLLGGVRGSMPFRNVYRFYSTLELMPWSKYKEEVQLYGNKASTSTYHINGGMQYLFSTRFCVDLSLGHTSNKATFEYEGPVTKQIRFKDSYAKFGTIYQF